MRVVVVRLLASVGGLAFGGALVFIAAALAIVSLSRFSRLGVGWSWWWRRWLDSLGA